MQKNTAFFNLFENVLIILQRHFGERIALKLFTEIMEKGLREAYGNEFLKGDLHEFARIVGERDHKVGLEVSFEFLNDHEAIYTFHEYPFPNLKDKISPEALDATFLNFKIEYLLGEDWNYQTLKHHFWGDEFSKFLIRKTT